MDKLMTPIQALVSLKDINSATLCLTSKTPKLAIICKEHGRQKAVDVIMLWIMDLNDFINVSRKMTEGQVRQTAEMILSDFYYMNIADINLVFTRAKKGHFGSLYESLDGMKIYQWFEAYAGERAQKAYSDKLKEHDIIKSNE